MRINEREVKVGLLEDMEITNTFFTCDNCMEEINDVNWFISIKQGTITYECPNCQALHED